MDKNHKPVILSWALIASIVIVVNLFFNVSLDMIYGSPQYDEYCETERVREVIQDETQCVESGGAWDSYSKPISGDEYVSGYCDQQYECRQDYEDARESYEKKVFITLTILGVITLIAGTVLNSNVVVGSALALSAVLNFFIASVRYWGSANEITKVVILGIALVSLIYIAYKKFGDK